MSFSDCHDEYDAWISKGYELRGNRYYKFNSTLTGYYNAKAQCEAEGGSLAIIEDHTDKTALQYYMGNLAVLSL